MHVIMQVYTVNMITLSNWSIENHNTWVYMQYYSYEQWTSY